MSINLLKILINNNLVCHYQKSPRLTKKSRLRQAREMGRRQTSTDSNSSNQSENSISSSSSSQVRMRKTPSSTPRRPKSACPIQRAKTETASEPISSRNSPKNYPKTPVQIVQKSTPLSPEKRKFSRQKSVNKWSMKEIS